MTSGPALTAAMAFSPPQVADKPLAWKDILPLPMTPPDPAELPTATATATDTASVVTAIHVISTERAALAHLEHLYQTNHVAQDNLARAVGQIVHCVKGGGKLVICGVGKSGKIGKKIEATMNSMGIHSAFLHPTEALHGDLGLIRPNDTLLLISFSGRTPELMLLLPHIPSTVRIIAITAHMHPSTCPLFSYVAPEMAILLPAPIHENEATSFGVCAPTSSTTVALSLGDALAIAAAHKMHTLPGRGPAEVFKAYHPGGAIGAAFTVSPALTISTSTSTTSFSSLPAEDFLRVKSTFPSSASLLMEVSSPSQDARSPLIGSLAVPTSHIPMVALSPENKRIRLLDVLLKVVQHPNSKHWLFLTESEIIPPQKIRALSRSSNVDMDVAVISDTDLPSPFAVHTNDWFRVSSSKSIDDVRLLVSNISPERRPLSVIGVFREENPEEFLGVLEPEDLWGDTG